MSEFVPSQSDQGIRVLGEGVKTLRNNEVSTIKKLGIVAGMILAAGYVVLPVDAIPDAIPVAGTIDDFGVMSAALLATLNAVKSKINQPGLTGWEKFFFALGGIYAVMPVDLIPDAIPIAGTADDLVIMMGALVPWLIQRSKSKNQ